jgi:DNA-binding NtrC family response regulator
VPPLRERYDDVRALVAEAAMRSLSAYCWPGNVRQLRKCIERLVVFVQDPVIYTDDLLQQMLNSPRPDGRIDLDATVQEAEKATILAALAQCNQHGEKTAQVLGISVGTLRYKRNRYSLK